MSDHVADLKKYTGTVDEAAVAAIVKYCGIALQSADASLVATSDPKELKTVREGFAAKKLGLGAEAADAGMKAAAETMKAASRAA
jgi:hypothetical protein